MNPINWTGVYPAITTPFFDNEELDHITFASHVKALVDAGCDAVIIGGSLGESSTLTHDCRMRLFETARQSIPQHVPILMNIAEGSLSTAIRLVKRCETAGVDGFMVLPPLLYRPLDAEVVNFFTAIADATSLPIMIYNNPVDYKVEVTVDMFDRLLRKPNIQAVKESTRDLTNVSRYRSHFGDRLKILTGVDTIATESLIMGADGWVAGLVNAFPDETVAIYRLIKAGRVEEAIAIHRWFLPALELDINAQLVQNIKLAAVMTGLCTEPVRPPRYVLEGKERERVIRVVQSCLDSRPVLPKDIQ